MAKLKSRSKEIKNDYGVTMKTIIEGKNINLTSSLKEYINEKLSKLDNHYEQLIKGHDVKVKLCVERNPRINNKNTAEVTIFLDGKIIRSEQSSEDMYASIDLVVDKISRQIERHKSKLYRSYQHNHRPEPNPEFVNGLIENNKKQSTTNKIIKKKKFNIQQMTPEEAIEHLDLIDHDFYVFINSKTNIINTVYKRKDGNYGLLEPNT